MNQPLQHPASEWLERTFARGVPGSLLLMLFGVLTTLGALDAPLLLAYDDNWVTTHNPIIKHGFGYFWTQLAMPFGNTSEAGFDTAHWSPLVLLSFAVDHSIFGRGGATPEAFAPWSFRLVNGLLHGLCAWLVLRFALRLTRRFEVAFGTALLFLFHPSVCESVCWIVERNNILPVLFGLAALYVYTGADEEHWTWEAADAPIPSSGTPDGGFLEPSWPRTLAAFGLLLLGQLCKPSGVSWWPIIVGADLLLMPGRSWPRRIGRWTLLFLPIAMNVYVTTKSHVDSVQPPIWPKPLGPWLASAYLAVRYAGLALLPWPLSAFYHVPTSGPVWTTIIGGWAFFAAVVAGAWKIGVPGRHLVFYILWLVATVGLVINPFMSTAYLIQDRYLYPAMPALGMLLFEVLQAAIARLKVKPVLLLLPAGTLMLVLLPLAISQSFVWNGEQVLFSHAVKHQPKTAFSHQYLGSYLFNAARDEHDAEKRRQMLAISLTAHEHAAHCDDYNRLPWSLNYRNEYATLLLGAGKREEARQQFLMVAETRQIRIHERGAHIYALRFLAFDALSAGQFDPGLQFVETGLREAPDDVALLRYRLQAYRDMKAGDKLRAEAHRLREHPVLGPEARALLDLASRAKDGEKKERPLAP